MDAIQKPEDNFLHHREYEKLPQNVTLEWNSTRTECCLKYNTKHIPVLWEDILGLDLTLPFNVMHLNSALVWYLGSDMWLPGFLKGVTLTLTDQYIKSIQSGNPGTREDIDDVKIKVRTTANSVGERSFGLVMEASRTSDNLPIFTYQNIMLPIDIHKMKLLKALPSEWKRKFLKQLDVQGRTNTKVSLPKYPESFSRKFSRTFMVQNEHIDENKHANYKVYMLATIGCIKDALKCNVLHGLSTENTMIREISIVFEGESKLGDSLRVDLLLTDDRSRDMYVVTYNGDRRLCYAKVRFESNLHSKM